MAQGDNADVVRGMLDAFNRGDVDAVVAAFDEGCRIDEPPEMPDRRPGGYRGHDGIREWMANLREVGGIRFEARSFAADGDRVVSEWVGSGRGHASEVPFEWTSFVVLDLVDGRIVRARAFLSSEEARAAAG